MLPFAFFVPSWLKTEISGRQLRLAERVILWQLPPCAAQDSRVGRRFGASRIQASPRWQGQSSEVRASEVSGICPGQRRLVHACLSVLLLVDRYQGNRQMASFLCYRGHEFPVHLSIFPYRRRCHDLQNTYALCSPLVFMVRRIDRANSQRLGYLVPLVVLVLLAIYKKNIH